MSLGHNPFLPLPARRWYVEFAQMFMMMWRIDCESVIHAFAPPLFGAIVVLWCCINYLVPVAVV